MEGFDSFNEDISSKIGKCVLEMLNAATSFHLLHLKITGPGAKAIHEVLQELYEEIPDMADDLAEGFQGASNKLLKYPENSSIKILISKEEAVSYIEELYMKASHIQEKIEYPEIVADIDTFKSFLNKKKYKLIFLT